MNNQPPDLTTIIREHIASAESHEVEARHHYEQAARTIEQALVNMNQSEVARLIGKNKSWVSRLMKWHRAGHPVGTIFDGGGSRPKKQQRPNWWSSVGHSPQAGRDEAAGQVELFPLLFSYTASRSSSTISGGWPRLRDYVLSGGLPAIDELGAKLGLERKSTWGDVRWQNKVLNEAKLTQASRHFGQGNVTPLSDRVLAVLNELQRKMLEAQFSQDPSASPSS